MIEPCTYKIKALAVHDTYGICHVAFWRVKEAYR